MNYFNALLVAVALWMPAGLSAAGHDFQAVEHAIVALEGKLSARIGVAVLEVKTGEQWNYKGDERFPLTSTFKTLACAKLLQDAEHQRLKLTDSVTVQQSDLVTYSPVIEKQVGQPVTLNVACAAAMHTSDNTAANIVLHAVGGPEGITRFMRELGDPLTRLDRQEPELNQGLAGDERDTTTPNAIARSLQTLLFGSALSPSSQQQLQRWMEQNQVTGNLLRSVLPAGWSIADRSGAGGFGARSITAVVWAKNQSPLIISIYIAQTDAPMEARNQAIVTLGQAIFNRYLPQP
ncbi:class A beta-lactamase [Pseudaeromonas pectinilytica]